MVGLTNGLLHSHLHYGFADPLRRLGHRSLRAIPEIRWRCLHPLPGLDNLEEERQTGRGSAGMFVCQRYAGADDQRKNPVLRGHRLQHLRPSLLQQHSRFVRGCRLAGFSGSRRQSGLATGRQFSSKVFRKILPSDQYRLRYRIGTVRYLYNCKLISYFYLGVTIYKLASPAMYLAWGRNWRII